MPLAKELAARGLWDPLMDHFGTAIFNVMIFCRLALPDGDTLMSPCHVGNMPLNDPKTGKPRWLCCVGLEYYTPGYLSEFEALASVILPLWLQFCEARLHWGKY